MKTLTLLMVLAVGLAGCSKEEEPKADMMEPTPAPAEKSEPEEKEVALTGPDLAPEDPTTELGEYPVAADLEEEADKVVVIDNLEAELDRLEAEIEG